MGSDERAGLAGKYWRDGDGWVDGPAVKLSVKRPVMSQMRTTSFEVRGHDGGVLAKRVLGFVLEVQRLQSAIAPLLAMGGGK